MEQEKVEVYIKINESNEIIEINSSMFMENADGYIKIDEGYGDKYVHAQGNYLDNPVFDFKTGRYNYKYENGQIVENY